MYTPFGRASKYKGANYASLSRLVPGMRGVKFITLTLHLANL